MFKFISAYRFEVFGSILFLTLFYFLTSNVPIFGDANSKSVRATWFFDHNFSQFTVPTEISAGHPPLWELLIAFSWKLFGRQLEISRLLLLIFNILAYWQLIRFFRDNRGTAVPRFAILLILIEPVLLAQTVFVNNDMMLLFFTLLALNSIYRNEKLLYSIALTGVLFSNLRGVSVFAALVLIDILYSWFRLKKENQKLLWQSYIMPILLFCGFLIYHYQLLGWVLKVPHHSHRELASAGQMIHNVLAITKNTIDYGHLSIYGLVLLLTVKLFKTKKWKQISAENKRLILSFAVFFGVFSGLFIMVTNPLGPRYYLITYLIIGILCINLIFEIIQNLKIRRLTVAFMAAVYITGHFWIWPPTIAQGWDATLVSLAYFPLRDKMENYIEENHLKKEEIGTELILNQPEFTDLKEPAASFFADLDTSKNKYIIFSNIDNQTSDEDIYLLEHKWILVKSYKRLGVFMNLYKNPDFKSSEN